MICCEEKKAIIIILIGIILFAVGLFIHVYKKQSITLDEMVQSKVNVEVGNISMKNDTEGTAKIKVTYPDFGKIIIKGSNEKEYEKNLKATIKAKDCPMKTSESTAPVTVNDGKQSIDYENVVNQILEDSLIEMINNIEED